MRTDGLSDSTIGRLSTGDSMITMIMIMTFT